LAHLAQRLYKFSDDIFFTKKFTLAFYISSNVTYVKIMPFATTTNVCN